MLELEHIVKYTQRADNPVAPQPLAAFHTRIFAPTQATNKSSNLAAVPVRNKNFATHVTPPPCTNLGVHNRHDN